MSNKEHFIVNHKLYWKQKATAEKYDLMVMVIFFLFIFALSYFYLFFSIENSEIEESVIMLKSQVSCCILAVFPGIGGLNSRSKDHDCEVVCFSTAVQDIS